ncbi:lamin-like protein [Zingiber officinale]|uniref:lamin-like protein n=1 Tax=Zingiber officinale TaxID=94328 RepID=UPI001C4CE9E5|nr:lamin-like protein [Zingiber officinale]
MVRKLLLPFFLFLSLSSWLASADRFTVGDSQAWNPNVNYTAWVDKHKPFHVGDWLVFYYQPGMADVVQVDEAGYNNCDASSSISNYSKGRSYAFQLNHTGDYYFICSRGFCYGGMRLAIVSQPLPPPSPPPSSHNDLSAAPRSCHAPAFPLLAIAIAATAAALLALLQSIA